MTELNTLVAFQKGIHEHRAGRLQDAEKFYRGVLRKQRCHAGANYCLGVLLTQRGQGLFALPFLSRAVTEVPDNEQYYVAYLKALLGCKCHAAAKALVHEAASRGIVLTTLNSWGELVGSLDSELDVSRSYGDVSSTPLQDQDGAYDKKTVGDNQPSGIASYVSTRGKIVQHCQDGRLIDARALAQDYIKTHPEDPFGWKSIGFILQSLGFTAESLEPLRQAIRLSKEDAETHNFLGVTLQRLGESKSAVESYQRALYLDPKCCDAHFNLAGLLYNDKNFRDAEYHYRRTTELKPLNAEAHCDLGLTLQALGRLEESESCFMHSIALQPNLAPAYNNLGLSLQEMGRLNEAVSYYEKALELLPENPEFQNNLAVIFQHLGDFENAERRFIEALRVKPNFAAAHRNLSEIRTYLRADDWHYRAMNDLYIAGRLSQSDRSHISFGLAKACDDLGFYDQAFKFWQEANTLKGKLIEYDSHEEASLLDRIKSNSANIEKLQNYIPRKTSDVIPIFIVGMPRSGTSLVEQIISSHSQVTGAGELNYVEQFGLKLASGLTQVSAASVQDFRDNYMEKLLNRADGKRFVTDKMPQNFRFVGLITKAIPEAKIIHVERNAAAVCWGIYRRFFSSPSMNFSYDIETVVQTFMRYRTVMSFWKEKLGESQIFDLNYELLTERQETETKRLVRFIGLDWEDACLRPENNSRGVSTASSVQVRRPLYRASKETWRRYEPFAEGKLECLSHLS